MPITITSRFKPLTYDEITRPLIEQTQAQQALENAYVEASDQAAQIMAQANEQTDPIAYARLKNYSDALQQQADALMKQGLNRGSRQSLLNMRRRYAQDIIPIQAAVERRNALQDERRKLSLTHPDMLWERDVIGLDDLLQNPQMDYGKTLMGSDISKRAAALTAAIGRGRQSVALGQNLDKYTQTVLSQSGLTPNQIQAALNGNAAEADKVLEKALAGLYSSTGVDSWGNQSAQDAVMSYIQEGAMQGVGEYKIGTQKDAHAIRQDEIADRELEWNRKLALNGLKEVNGEIVADTENPVYRQKYGYQPSAINPATGIGYKDGELSRVGDHYENEAGEAFFKVRKDVYVPYTKETKLTQAQQTALDTWKNTNGGYIAGFDEDNDYANPKKKFIDILSRMVTDTGEFDTRVQVIPANADLDALNQKEREKVAATIQQTKIPSENFTVIKVKRAWPTDDDVFVIYNEALDMLKQEVLNKKGINLDEGLRPVEPSNKNISAANVDYYKNLGTPSYF